MKKWLIIVFGVIALAGVYVTATQKDHTQIHTLPSSKAKQNTTPSFNKTQRSLNDPTSIWVVVNKNRPLHPIDYAPDDLIDVSNGQELRKEAADALATMFKDASAQGFKLIAVSGYRSYQTQISVYNSEVQGVGEQTANQESAKPGHSEHQTGLAIDVGGGGCNIDDCFATTKEGQWVAVNSYKYGFLLRYPADKVAVTGYRYEPWHLRYIGTELSNELHRTDIRTLEEFFGLH